MHTPPPNDLCSNNRLSGFSLVEVVIVVTIIGIFSAIAIPRYANSLVRYRLDAAAHRVVADLDYARQLARQTSASKTVHFMLSPDKVHLMGVPDPDDPGIDYMTCLNVAPYRAAIDSADFGGDTKVIFDGYGMPDSDGSVQISIGSDVRTITVDANSGEATIQ